MSHNYLEKRRTIKAIGIPMQNIIINSPIKRPESVGAVRGAGNADSGNTMKFMNRYTSTP